ncbi:MAG TPA: riboflavin synthase [Vicinamibacterales bacterium]
MIETVGRVVDRQAVDGGCRLRIRTVLAPELSLGDSVAINGVCLTVAKIDSDDVLADLGPETMRVTTLGALPTGASVNVERPLRADSRFGGHFVQGHVDGVGRIEAIQPEAEFHWVTVAFPSELAPYLVHKGSVAVDGISLTVARLGIARFDVQIVPFTMTHTNLGTAKSHDRVNLECDMVGKYVVRAAEIAGLALAGTRSQESGS